MAEHRTPDHASPEPIDTLLTQAFAPMHKRALGLAVGATAGVGMFLLTAFHLIIVPAEAGTVELLSQYFYGYRVDWTGAFIGAWWGGFAGFVGGWFLAFTRNLAIAIWLRFVKARAELLETRDFLDHM